MIASRPIVVTPSCWSGCCWPASSPGHGSRASRRRRCGTSSGARDAVRQDLMRCRHRLSKLLLRHGHRFDDGPAWTQRHREWLAGIDLGQPAAQTTMLDAHGAIDALIYRRDAARARDRRAAARLAVGDPGQPVALSARHRHPVGGRLVRRGRRLRALRTRRAADELRRPGAQRVDTTGHSRRQGAITKTGSGHARRLLVEAAWNYRGHPGSAKPLTDRQRRPARRSDRDRLSAQRRLHRTWATPRSRNTSGAPSSPSPSPANSPASVGPRAHRARPVTRTTTEHPVGWAGGGPATRGESATGYEQPAPQQGLATPDF